jgi:uncharacterized protein
VYPFSSLVVTGVLCFLGGVGIGAFAFHIFRTQFSSRNLEQRLHKAESDLQSYQRDVAEHFTHTSDLINNMTNAYRDVHEHLATGALKLATPAISRQILNSANSNLASGGKTYIKEQRIEPPRDWAPKSATSKSLANDDFGLDDEHRDHPSAPVVPVSADDYDFDGKANRY